MTRGSRDWWVPKTQLFTRKDCAQRVIGFGRPAEVTFSGMTTAEALQRFAKDPQKRVCALNFANGKHVGGGYKKGAIAQEEDLCRQIPTLYSSLYNAQQKDKLYPFGPSA